MLDNQLFQLFDNVLNAGLAVLQLNGIVGLRQKYLPTQIGTPSKPTIFIYKIGDRRWGVPKQFSQYSSGAAVFTGSIAGNVLTVTSVASGALELNQEIGGSGIPAGVIIQSYGTGEGQTGTYILNQQLTVNSESMTSSAAEVQTYIQQYETTFQISSLAAQDPSNPNQLTASDIVNYAAQIMQSNATVATLEASDVGVLRVGDIRNPYFSDDRVRYEASPNFDVTLTHKQIILTAPPILTGETAAIYQV